MDNIKALETALLQARVNRDLKAHRLDVAIKYDSLMVPQFQKEHKDAETLVTQIEQQRHDLITTGTY